MNMYMSCQVLVEAKLDPSEVAVLYTSAVHGVEEITFWLTSTEVEKA